MNRNIILVILGVCLAIGVGIGVYNLPQNDPPNPNIVDNNETEVVIDVNDTDIIIIDNDTNDVENNTEEIEEFTHNFSRYTLLK